MGTQAGKDGGAIAGGKDAGLQRVNKTANFGTAGFEFITKEFEVREIDTRQYVVNIAE